MQAASQEGACSCSSNLGAVKLHPVRKISKGGGSQSRFITFWGGGGDMSWHAIKKFFNPPFLILKVRHPAVTWVYCIVRDSRSGCSNDFKCLKK